MIIKIINITLDLLALRFVLSASVVTMNSENHPKGVGVTSMFIILMRKKAEAEPLAQTPQPGPGRMGLLSTHQAKMGFVYMFRLELLSLVCVRIALVCVRIL